MHRMHVVIKLLPFSMKYNICKLYKSPIVRLCCT